MTRHRTTLLSTALATVLVAGLESRPACADPGEPTAVEARSYNHAPVTLWLIPQLGTAGMSSRDVRTNFALSLGASGYARLDGVDLAVGASWITDEMRGVQLTAGLNHVGGDARGAQVTAGVNHADADLRGVQVAAVANVAPERVMGAQIALVNVGGQVSGAQIGLVNIAGGVKGTQIGLVNVADDSSAPIGLVNVIKNGRHHVDVWGSEAAPLNLSLKLGGRHVYSVLAAGYGESEGTRRWLAGVGIGGHVPISGRFYLEPEAITFHVNEGGSFKKDTNSLSTLRLIGGYRVSRSFAVFGGPTLNLLVTRVGDGEGFGLIRGTRLTSEGNDTTVRAWPGFVAGFQI